MWTITRIALLTMLRMAEGSPCLDSAVCSLASPCYADSDLRNVEYKGRKYSLPLARGIWTSPRVPFHVMNILLREKMGINTTAIQGLSSENLLTRVSTPLGDFGIPEAWAANEVWTSGTAEKALRQKVSGASFSGYISDPGLRALPSSYEMAKDAGILLGFWESLKDPATKTCCFSDLTAVKAAMTDEGYTASQIAPGQAKHEKMVDLGHASHIQDGWYIASECRADISNCIPVLLGEFDWNLPEWVAVAEENKLPFAITSYGWVTGSMKAVTQLAARDLKFLFYWWEPDNTFQALEPKMILFREGMLTIKQTQPTEKIVWNKLLEVDRGEDILNFFSRATFTNAQMNVFVTRQLTEDNYDIACDWLKNNEATWESWLPNTTNCEKGFFYSATTKECIGCASGRFAPQRGMTECMECGAGEFQAQMGKTACEPCLAGTSSEGAAAICSSCALGTWQNESGKSRCEPCGEGGLTTRWPGSTTQEQCVCQQGSYRPLEIVGDVQCESCPEGMTCALGSDIRNMVQGPGPFSEDQPPFPQLGPGYMSLASDPLHIYKCVPEDNCVGGGTASCAALRDVKGIACGECMAGAYASGSGDCQECGSMGGWRFVVVAVVAIIGVGCLTVAVNRNLLLQTNYTIVCVVMAGLMFSGVQTMGIFNQLAIEWGGPMVAVLNLVDLLSFDLDVLGTSCTLGSNNPVNTFVLRQCVAPCSIPIIFIVLRVKKFSVPSTNIKVELLNTVGTVFNVFFISIVISGMSPFIIYKHPSGDWSMVSASSILWLGGSHVAMMVIGIVFLLLVPLPFLAGACCFISRYPAYLATSKEAPSRNQLQAWRFLYFRYSPDRYFYGILLLSRSLAICFVPVVIQDDVALQIIVMALVICTTTILQQQLNPWRNRVANWMDGIMSMVLLMLLLSGAMVADLQAKAATVEFVGLASVLLVFLVAGGTITWGLYRRLKPQPFYNYFICHHKADAAAQARLLKMKLQSTTRQSIFIDSDNLTELDDLFDIVKCKVEHVVVYLTRDTLSRPWCAGEIVTAFQAGLKVTAVKTPSFEPPSAGQLEKIDEYLDLTSCTLAEYGISFDDVRDAYTKLLSDEAPQLRLEKEGGVHNIDVLVGHLSSGIAAKLPGQKVEVNESAPSLPALPADLEGAVVVSSDHTDVEAAAAATILSTRIEEKVMFESDRRTVLFQDYQQKEPAVYGAAARKSYATVVLLSQGSMKSKSQLQVIIDAMAPPVGGAVSLVDDHEPGADAPVTGRALTGKEGQTPIAAARVGGPVVVPVVIDAFRFPDDAYYIEELPKILPETAEKARPLIQAFFKTIALPFSTGASDYALDIQSQEVFQRIFGARSRAATAGAAPRVAALA